METEEVLDIPETSVPEGEGETALPEEEGDQEIPDSDESDTTEGSAASSLKEIVDPASTGAEGRSTNQATAEEPEKEPRMLLDKIVLDQPQATYIMKHYTQKVFFLAREDSRKIYSIVYYHKEPDFYDNINRSYKVWPDIRSPKNFLYSKGRVEDVEKICKDYNMETRNISFK